MKCSSRFCGFIILVFSLFVLVHIADINSNMDPCEQAESVALDSHAAEETRPSITFILGEDKPAGNPFYAEATNFYRYHPEERAEILITHCRSLLDMRNVLEEQAAYQSLPWGTVNVVVHSNQWQGMAVAVLEEGGTRTTVDALETAVAYGLIFPLSDSILDHQTEIVIYGCGLGKNEDLLHSLSYALGGEDEARPIVRSSKQFIYFDSQTLNGMPVNCQRYLSDYWFTHYPSYYHPGDHILARRLEQSYPEVSIDWQAALGKQSPDFAGDAFSMEFKVPIVWYVTYEHASDRPNLASPKQQVEWVKEQEEIVAAAEGYGFEVEDFRWTVRKATYEYEDGTSEPAMKAIGFCSIVSVLRPLTQENDGKFAALTPSLTDDRFFGRGGPLALDQQSGQIEEKYTQN